MIFNKKCCIIFSQVDPHFFKDSWRAKVSSGDNPFKNKTFCNGTKSPSPDKHETNNNDIATDIENLGAVNSPSDPKTEPNKPVEVGRRIRLQRPRSHKIIMAEAQEKLEAEHRRREMEEIKKEREKEQERREANEKAYSESKKQRAPSSEEESDSLGGSGEQLPMFSALPPQFFSGVGRGVPVFVVPGEGQEMMMLMQALRQARQDANFHDGETTLSEETIPKIQLLDLESVDDVSPSVQPQASSQGSGRDEGSTFINSSQHRHESPSRDSPRKDYGRGRGAIISPRKVSSPRESPRRLQYNGDIYKRESPDGNSSRLDTPRQSAKQQSPSHRKEEVLSSESEYLELRPNTRGILDIINDPLTSQTESATDMSNPGSDGEGRHFPRVNITDPLKAILKKDNDAGGERRRDKSRSQSPRERRSLEPGMETTPKSILRNKSPTSFNRSNYDSSGSDTYERHRSASPAYDAGQRSRSPYDGGQRSTSPGYHSPRDRNLSPRVQRSRSPSFPVSDSEEHDPLSHPTTPGRQSDEPDPNRRLVRVLNRELELLKLKMDVLERTNNSNDDNLQDMNNMTKELSERVKDSITRRVNSLSPAPHGRRKSPETVELKHSEYDRGRMFRRKNDYDHRSKSESRTRSPFSSSPDRDFIRKPLSHSMQDLSVEDSITEAADGRISLSPQKKGKPISLGYASPIKKVSEEIWGIGADDDLEEFNERQIMKWRRLISAHADSDVVELKQALGTAISQNSIISAQLKNANTEIAAKMSKTNDVLNDCRAHLAKAQAENMELRTSLEKERSRNDGLEERHRDLETQLAGAKSANDDLEAQLEKTKSLLKGTPTRDIPTLQSLSDERDNLLDLVASTQKENTRLNQVIYPQYIN